MEANGVKILENTHTVNNGGKRGCLVSTKFPKVKQDVKVSTSFDRFNSRKKTD